MKKIILVLFIVTMILLINKGDTKVLIPKDAIRFRIVANSNSLEDQTLKLEIKEDLQPIITNIIGDSNNIDDARVKIKNNLYEVKNVLNNYDTSYKVNYGLNYFPEKNYDGVTYLPGNYESLVITLGDGLGDNWWCVLFPPLCLLEASEENLDDVVYTSYVKELLEKY